MKYSTLDPVVELFIECCRAIREGVPAIKRSARDKEFFFQDWVMARLAETDRNFEEATRNSYPDLRLVHDAQGFEVKGLAAPGRDKSYDCNSQVPTGLHNGRDIFYVFGRYPNDDSQEVPISDLVIVHGDFLNATHNYEHKNLSLPGFGTYGDLLLRDRKMYVAPTPYSLLEGVVGRRTLVVPKGQGVSNEYLCHVGDLARTEVEEMLVGYSFDLETNELTGHWSPNPYAGYRHEFATYRISADSPDGVSLMAVSANDLVED